MECSDPACNRPAKSRGFCQKHYMRWYRHGGDEPPLKKAHRSPVGHRYLRADGYIHVKVGPYERELEHRLVATQMIGRPLRTDEHVHHLNGDKADNRPENLVVMTNAEHQKLHDWHITKMRRIERVCEACGKRYLVKQSKAESRFCSNACRLPALWDARRTSAAQRRTT